MCWAVIHPLKNLLSITTNHLLSCKHWKKNKKNQQKKPAVASFTGEKPKVCHGNSEEFQIRSMCTSKEILLHSNLNSDFINAPQHRETPHRVSVKRTGSLFFLYIYPLEGPFNAECSLMGVVIVLYRPCVHARFSTSCLHQRARLLRPIGRHGRCW